MTYDRPIHIAPTTYLAAQTSLPLAAQFALKVAVLLTRWTRNVSTRRHLKDLPPHLLRDIGVDQLVAEREIEKPFWLR